MLRVLSAILAFAVAAALAGSGRTPWASSADARLLGEMPQAVVGQAARQDSHVVRLGKARGSLPLSVPCGLLPAAAPSPFPIVAIGLCARPSQLAAPAAFSFSSRVTRGPPGSDLPVVKS